MMLADWQDKPADKQASLHKVLTLFRYSGVIVLTELHTLRKKQQCFLQVSLRGGGTLGLWVMLRGVGKFVKHCVSSRHLIKGRSLHHDSIFIRFLYIHCKFGPDVRCV